jgi:hypothetical protein
MYRSKMAGPSNATTTSTSLASEAWFRATEPKTAKDFTLKS